MSLPSKLLALEKVRDLSFPSPPSGNFSCTCFDSQRKQIWLSTNTGYIIALSLDDLSLCFATNTGISNVVSISCANDLIIKSRNKIYRLPHDSLTPILICESAEPILDSIVAPHALICSCLHKPTSRITYNGLHLDIDTILFLLSNKINESLYGISGSGSLYLITASKTALSYKVVARFAADPVKLINMNNFVVISYSNEVSIYNKIHGSVYTEVFRELETIEVFSNPDDINTILILARNGHMAIITPGEPGKKEYFPEALPGDSYRSINAVSERGRLIVARLIKDHFHLFYYQNKKNLALQPATGDYVDLDNTPDEHDLSYLEVFHAGEPIEPSYGNPKLAHTFLPARSAYSLLEFDVKEDLPSYSEFIFDSAQISTIFWCLMTLRHSSVLQIELLNHDICSCPHENCVLCLAKLSLSNISEGDLPRINSILAVIDPENIIDGFFSAFKKSVPSMEMCTQCSYCNNITSDNFWIDPELSCCPNCGGELMVLGVENILITKPHQWSDVPSSILINGMSYHLVSMLVNTPDGLFVVCIDGEQAIFYGKSIYKIAFENLSKFGDDFVPLCFAFSLVPSSSSPLYSQTIDYNKIIDSFIQPLNDVPFTNELSNLKAEEFLGLDCEMVQKVFAGHSYFVMARLSLVRVDGSVVFDARCAQTEVSNYLTEYSGIEPGDLDLQSSKYPLFSSKSFTLLIMTLDQRNHTIIGHGLPSDFSVLNHVCSSVIDTRELYWHRVHGVKKSRSFSLQFLAQELLGETIQQITHDSVEDARMAVELWLFIKDLDAAQIEFISGQLYSKRFN